MAEHTAEEISKHVRTYILVFVALLILTAVTVGVFYIHLSVPAAVALALFVASIKASLVACYFMHLIAEKKMILWIMALTMFFFIVLILLPIFTEASLAVS